MWAIAGQPTRTGGADSARQGPRQRGYDRAWEKSRATFLRQFPLCGMRPNGQPPVMSQCTAEQRLTVATVVDHVRPHRGDAELFNNQANWQSMCAACHRRKTRAGL